MALSLITFCGYSQDVVAKITEEQRDLLRGRLVVKDVYFNVDAQDSLGNYYIGILEMAQCKEPDLQWIKQLPKSVYKPKPFTP